MTVTATILTCHVMQIAMKISAPPPRTPVPQPGIILVQKAKCTSCAQASWGGAQRGLAP